MALPAELHAAAHAGEVDRLPPLLAALPAGDDPTLRLLVLAQKLEDQPAARFAVLAAAVLRPPPTQHRREWLYNLNNTCVYAVSTGDEPTRLAVARRGLELGGENVDMLHNVACVFCALGRPDEAMAAVRAAVDHGYRLVPMLAADPDLALISSRPDFQALVAPVVERQRAEEERRLGALSRELLRGAPVPPVLRALWQEVWNPTGHGLPAGLELLDERAEQFADVLPDVDFFALVDDAGWLGLRGEAVVRVDEAGTLELAGASLLDALLLLPGARRAQLQALLHNAKVEGLSLDVRRARAEREALADAPWLAGLRAALAT